MKDTNPIIPILKDHPLFASLDIQTLQSLVTHPSCEALTYEAGDTIFSEDDYHKALGVVIKGSASVYRLGHGSPVLLNTLSRGDTFGSASLFNEEERYVTRISAKTRCQVFYLPAALCERLVKEDPRFAIAYIRFLSGRIRFLNKRIAELSAPAAAQKLAKYLSECEERISPNMVELANSLGIGRASLYRCLDDFIRRGLIHKQDHDILILDPEGIRGLI
jgi:CRP-like cAMP-binding protein